MLRVGFTWEVKIAQCASRCPSAMVYAVIALNWYCSRMFKDLFEDLSVQIFIIILCFHVSCSPVFKGSKTQGPSPGNVPSGGSSRQKIDEDVDVTCLTSDLFIDVWTGKLTFCGSCGNNFHHDCHGLESFGSRGALHRNQSMAICWGIQRWQRASSGSCPLCQGLSEVLQLVAGSRPATLDAIHSSYVQKMMKSAEALLEKWIKKVYICKSGSGLWNQWSKGH